MACFERFVKFINKNAYIQIALTGENFCTSCKQAFSCIMSNLARVVLISTIGGVFRVFGKMFIILGSLGLCYIILTNAEPYKTTI